MTTNQEPPHQTSVSAATVESSPGDAGDQTAQAQPCRAPLEPKPPDRDDWVLVGPTELLALLVTDAELRSWTLDDARRALAWRKAEVVRLPLVSSLASALETIGIQLEGGRGGSRFPGIWNLAVPLVEDEVSGWFLGFLDHVLADIATIEREFETLSIGRAATVWLGDEGFPEIYGRESPGLEARYGGEGRGRNLRAWFAATIDEVKALCADAKGAGKAVVLVREGVRVTYLWNFAPRTSPGDGLR